MPITEEDLCEIQHDLEGTCRSLGEIIDQRELDCDADELEDRLLDPPYPIERSVCCGWWFEVCALEYSEEHGGSVCDQCAPELFQ